MKQDYIPGIYNYCDRWCERCHFTSRCRNYDSTSSLPPEEQDINNKAFWDKISLNFKEAIRLLAKAADQHGIDLNKPLTQDEEAAFQQRQSFLKDGAKQHPLSLLCKKYQKLSRPFFQENEAFVDKTRELVEHLHIGITTEENVVNTVAAIGECFEVIQWYLYFIDAKLQRSLHGKLDGEKWQEENGFQKDSDGSAKVAIIAIERSIGAWKRLYDLLPSSEDVILNALSLLSQLLKNVKEEFPKALDFKRPGFDDNILPLIQL